MTSHRLLLTGVVLAAALPLAACGSSDPLGSTAGRSGPAAAPGATSPATGAGSTLTIGSADFPESSLLGEVYAQALEAKGLTVKRTFNIGSREIYLKAVASGEVDIMPEYTGSLTNYYNKSYTATAPDAVYAELQKSLPPELTVLAKSAAEDKNSITVTKATADAWKLKAIPDLVPYQDQVSLGAPPEFKTREQGLAGLKRVYNLVPKEFRPLKSQAAADALKNGQVKAANIFTTDPSIAANGFVVLDDPKRLFGSDNVVPLLRKQVVDPTVTGALDAVSAKLDTPALAQLVKEVVVDHKDAKDVAKAWLASVGLS